MPLIDPKMMRKFGQVFGLGAEMAVIVIGGFLLADYLSKNYGKLAGIISLCVVVAVGGFYFYLRIKQVRAKPDEQ